MTNIAKKTLLTIFTAAAALLTGCDPETSMEGEPDVTDYQVTAFTPKGDTAWTAIADDLAFQNTNGAYNAANVALVPGGVLVEDKKTGQIFAASNSYVVKSIPAVK